MQPSTFTNYGCFFSNNQETHSCFCQTLIVINKPINYVPVHILGASLVCAWRDQASSALDRVARRLTCGITLGALAIIGLIDTVARLGIALFKSLQGSKDDAKAYLASASMGIQHSVYFVTSMEVHNLHKYSILPLLLRP